LLRLFRRRVVDAKGTAGTGGRSAEDQAYLNRYNEFLRNGRGGGDSPSTNMQGFIENEHATGHMSDAAYDSYVKSRAVAGAVGSVGSVAGVFLRTGILGASNRGSECLVPGQWGRANEASSLSVTPRQSSG
jgi:hypothetical protein